MVVNLFSGNIFVYIIGSILVFFDEFQLFVFHFIAIDVISLLQNTKVIE